jgi:hypothetical protein
MSIESAGKAANLQDSELAGLSMVNICLSVAALSIPTTVTTFAADLLGGGIASIFVVFLLCVVSFFTARIFNRRNIVPQRREFLVVAILFVATGILGLLQLSGLLSAINGNPGLVADMGGNEINLNLSNYLNPFIPATFCFFSWYKKPPIPDSAVPERTAE